MTLFPTNPQTNNNNEGAKLIDKNIIKPKSKNH